MSILRNIVLLNACRGDLGRDERQEVGYSQALKCSVVVVTSDMVYNLHFQFCIAVEHHPSFGL